MFVIACLCFCVCDYVFVVVVVNVCVCGCVCDCVFVVVFVFGLWLCDSGCAFEGWDCYFNVREFASGRRRGINLASQSATL